MYCVCTYIYKIYIYIYTYNIYIYTDAYIHIDTLIYIIYRTQNMIRIYRSSDKTVVSKCVLLLFDWNHPISKGGQICSGFYNKISVKLLWLSENLAGFVRRHASSSATGSDLHRWRPIHWSQPWKNKISNHPKLSLVLKSRKPHMKPDLFHLAVSEIGVYRYIPVYHGIPPKRSKRLCRLC